MEPSSKKRKLAPKVNTAAAPNPQPAAQYSHETVSLASLSNCLASLALSPSLFISLLRVPSIFPKPFPYCCFCILHRLLTYAVTHV